MSPEQSAQPNQLPFIPGIIGFILIYLRTRRLAPLIVAHWMMDITAVVMTTKF